MDKLFLNSSLCRIIHVGRNEVAQLVCRNRANASGGVTQLVHALCGEKRPKFRHSMRLLVPAYKLVNNSGLCLPGVRFAVFPVLLGDRGLIDFHKIGKLVDSTVTVARCMGVDPEDGRLAALKTYVAKPGEVEQKWYVVDATDRVLGRLSRDIAMILMGKHRPTYTPHVDTGDFVIVTNVEKVALSGKKWEQKRYTWYTGYPGLREEMAADRRDKNPQRIVHDAVRRMLPKNKLARKMLAKLKLYVGPDHPHQAQQPVAIELGTKKK